jgi:hypothetical protein
VCSKHTEVDVPSLPVGRRLHNIQRWTFLAFLWGEGYTTAGTCAEEGRRCQEHRRGEGQSPPASRRGRRGRTVLLQEIRWLDQAEASVNWPRHCHPCPRRATPIAVGSRLPSQMRMRRTLRLQLQGEASDVFGAAMNGTSCCVPGAEKVP